MKFVFMACWSAWHEWWNKCLFAFCRNYDGIWQPIFRQKTMFLQCGILNSRKIESSRVTFLNFNLTHNTYDVISRRYRVICMTSTRQTSPMQWYHFQFQFQFQTFKAAASFRNFVKNTRRTSIDMASMIKAVISSHISNLLTQFFITIYMRRPCPVSCMLCAHTGENDKMYLEISTLFLFSLPLFFALFLLSKFCGENKTSWHSIIFIN